MLSKVFTSWYFLFLSVLCTHIQALHIGFVPYVLPACNQKPIHFSQNSVQGSEYDFSLQQPTKATALQALSQQQQHSDFQVSPWSIT